MIRPILSIACLLSQTAATGYEVVPLLKSTHSSLAGNNIVKRFNEDYTAQGLKNDGGTYWAVLKMGSDEQEQLAYIDTGSADLWVRRKSDAQPKGFDTNTSSTAWDLHEKFDIGYLSGSAHGEFYKDTVKWGDAEVDLQFAVVDSSSITHGILGISFDTVESVKASQRYPNYPMALKEQGYTESVSYSICLDAAPEEGAIVFGALDSSRYVGPLKEMRLEHNGSARVNFTVAGHALAGALDTGTTNFIVPEAVRADIAKSVNATWDDDRQNYIRYGSIEGARLDLNFDGINVTMFEHKLFRPIVHGGPGWVLNVNSQGSTVLLGQKFLTSAYVVYDLERQRIAIAQSNPSPGPPNYQIINGSIPGAI